jgi:RNA polymerase sigma-70 factor (ECF subfamily)
MPLGREVSATMTVSSATVFVEANSSLLERIQRGDQPAMAFLFDRYSAVVYSIALRVLHDSFAAEEVLQEIFMDIWRAPSEFAAAAGVLEETLAVASRNRAVEVLRKRRRSDSVTIPIVYPNRVREDDEGRRLRVEFLRTAIAALSAEKREALESAFFGGCTTAEIAENMGLSREAANAALFGALRTISMKFQSETEGAGATAGAHRGVSE